MKKKEIIFVYNYINTVQKPLFWYEKLSSNFYYYYIKLREFFTGKSSFANFVYETNTQCTLRCKDCHSYMPYFKKHYMADFETFKTEIDKLLKSVDLITSFRLQGGETLLVKDLPKMVEYACSKKQIQHIQIITNGTIIPSQELLNAMKNPKVILDMSDYSNNKELSGKLKYNEITKLCNENGVKSQHWIIPENNNISWEAKKYISNEKINDINLAIKNFAACHCFNEIKVYMFFHGKLYICPPAVYFANTNPNFLIPEDEIVDIINTPQKLLSKKLKNFVNKKVYMLCARCDAAKNEKLTFPPALQLNSAECPPPKSAL